MLGPISGTGRIPLAGENMSIAREITCAHQLSISPPPQASEQHLVAHMKPPRRQFLHLAAGAIAAPAFSQIAAAQTYPIRPITIIVPFAAGGPTDTIARVLAERMK